MSFLPRYWVSFRPASASALLVVVFPRFFVSGGIVGGQWVISGTAWDDIVSGMWVFVTVAFCSPVLTVNALKGWVGDDH